MKKFLLDGAVFSIYAAPSLRVQSFSERSKFRTLQVKTFKGYLSFYCVLQTSAVFVLTRSICARLEKFSHCKAYYAFQQLISKLAPLTFGVYLIHKYLVTYLPEILPVDQYSLAWRLGEGLVIFALCSLLSAGIARISYARNVLLGTSHSKSSHCNK